MNLTVVHRQLAPIRLTPKPDARMHIEVPVELCIAGLRQPLVYYLEDGTLTPSVDEYDLLFNLLIQDDARAKVVFSATWQKHSVKAWMHDKQDVFVILLWEHVEAILEGRRLPAEFIRHEEILDIRKLEIRAPRTDPPSIWRDPTTNMYLD